MSSRTTTDIGTPGLAIEVQRVVSSDRHGEMLVHFCPQEKKVLKWPGDLPNPWALYGYFLLNNPYLGQLFLLASSLRVKIRNNLFPDSSIHRRPTPLIHTAWRVNTPVAIQINTPVAIHPPGILWQWTLILKCIFHTFVPQFGGWPFAMHEPLIHARHMEKITFSQLPKGRDQLSHMDKNIVPKSSFTDPRLI